MVKVIKQYVDKYTHEMVYAGTELKEVPEKRLKELIEAGVVEAEPEEKPKQKKE